MRIGVLYFDWGKRKDKQAEYKDALTKYNESLASFRQAKQAFETAENRVGINKAIDGLEEATRRSEDIKPKLKSQAALKEFFSKS